MTAQIFFVLTADLLTNYFMSNSNDCLIHYILLYSHSCLISFLTKYVPQQIKMSDNLRLLGAE